MHTVLVHLLLVFSHAACSTLYSSGALFTVSQISLNNETLGVQKKFVLEQAHLTRPDGMRSTKTVRFAEGLLQRGPL